MLLADDIKPISPQAIRTAVEQVHKRGSHKETFETLGLDAICELISQGATITAVAKTIGCSGNYLGTWIASQDDGYEKLSEARQAAADLYATLADQAIQGALLDKDSIARANAQQAHYMKMAAFFNPDRFAPRKTEREETGPVVQFNIDLGLPDDSQEEGRIIEGHVVPVPIVGPGNT